MSRHRKIAAGIWGDDRFASLSDDAQRLWFYLLTGHEVTNLPGLLIVGKAGLAETLRWDVDRMMDAFSELEAAVDPEDGLPLARADWRARVVYLPNGIFNNLPTNSNVIAGWKAPWVAIPECALKAEAYDMLRTACTSLAEWAALAFDKYVKKPKTLRAVTDLRKGLTEGSCDSFGEPVLARARAAPASDPTPAPVSSGGDARGGGQIVHAGTAAAVELFDGFLSAVAEAAEHPRTGLRPPERDALIEAANVHFRADWSARGVLDAQREAVFEWVDAYADKRQFTRGWSAHKFVEWLNSERDTSDLPEPPPRQSETQVRAESVPFVSQPTGTNVALDIIRRGVAEGFGGKLLR